MVSPSVSIEISKATQEGQDKWKIAKGKMGSKEAKSKEKWVEVAQLEALFTKSRDDIIFRASSLQAKVGASKVRENDEQWTPHGFSVSTLS